MPSFILIRPTVWPQYTNVSSQTGQTDRQPDRQTTVRQHRANRFTNGRPTICEHLAKLQARRVFTRSGRVPGQLSCIKMKIFSSIFGQPFVKWFALCYCYRTVVCVPVLSVCSVCDVGVLWPNGWMDHDAAWYEGRPRPRPHCVRWEPNSPNEKWGLSSPHFRPMSIVAKRLPISATAELLYVQHEETVAVVPLVSPLILTLLI